MTLLLFLPAEEGVPWRWLRIGEPGAGDTAVGRARMDASGEGVPDPAADPRVIAVAPAAAVALHWAPLPDRSIAQAIAAARLLVAEASAAPIGDLHVAVGAESEGERAIGVVAAEAMRGWLALLAAVGIDPIAIVPAPLLLPRPEEGFVRAEVGGARVLRGRNAALAEEPPLSDLVTGDAPIAEVAPDALAAAMLAVAETPPLDLRQGPFARRTRRAIDWPLVRRLAALGGLVLALMLATDLVRIARYTLEARRTEARAEALARGVLPRGAPQDGDAERLLAERLATLRGPGLGFTRTTASAFGAVESVPGVALTRLDFAADGGLRLAVSTEGEAQANAVKRALEATGFAVTASPFQANGTRLSGELTVALP